MTAQSVAMVACGRQVQHHRMPAAASVAMETGVYPRAVVEPDVDMARAYLARYRNPAFLAALRTRGYDITPEAAEMVAAAEVFRDLEPMLDAVQPDYVVAATPAQQKVETAVRCLRGADVLSEKTMAPDLAGREAIAEAADASGNVAMIGYWPQYQLDWALREIETGALGGALGARIRWVRADGLPGPSHFWNDRRTGGVLLDLGVYGAIVRESLGISVVEVRVTEFSNEAGRARNGGDFVCEDTVTIQSVAADGSVFEDRYSWADGGPADEEFVAELYKGGEMQVYHPFIVQKAEDYLPEASGFVPLLRGGAHGDAPLTYTGCLVAQQRDFYGGAPRLSLPQTMRAERFVDRARASMFAGGKWMEV